MLVFLLVGGGFDNHNFTTHIVNMEVNNAGDYSVVVRINME